LIFARFVEIDYHSRRGRNLRVDAHAHRFHTVTIDGDTARLGARNRVGEIEHNPIGLFQRGDFGCDRRAGSDLDADVLAAVHHIEFVQRSLVPAIAGALGGLLRGGQAQAQHQHSRGDYPFGNP
jgi:hypothetical protein